MDFSLGKQQWLKDIPTNKTNKATSQKEVASSLPGVGIGTDLNFADKAVANLTKKTTPKLNTKTPSRTPSKEGYSDFVKPYTPTTKKQLVENKFGSTYNEYVEKALGAPAGDVSPGTTQKIDYTSGRSVLGQYDGSIFTKEANDKYEADLNKYNKKLTTVYENLKNSNSSASKKFIETNGKNKYEEYVKFQEAKSQVFSQEAIWTKKFERENKDLIKTLQVDDTFKATAGESFAKGVLLDSTIGQAVTAVRGAIIGEDTLMLSRAADERSRELAVEGKYSENAYVRIGGNLLASMPIYMGINSAIVSGVSAAAKYSSFAKSASDFISKAPVLSEIIMDNTTEIVEYGARKALGDENYTVNDMILGMGIASTAGVITGSIKKIQINKANELAEQYRNAGMNNSDIKDALLKDKSLVDGKESIQDLIDKVDLKKTSSVPTKITKANIQKYIFDRTGSVTSSKANRQIATVLNHLDSKITKGDSTDAYAIARSQIIEGINGGTIRSSADTESLINKVVESTGIKLPKNSKSSVVDDVEELVLNPRFDNSRATKLIENGDYDGFKKYMDELRLPEGETVADALVKKSGAKRGFKKVANEITMKVKRSQAKAYKDITASLKKLPIEKQAEFKKLITSSIESERKQGVKELILAANKQADDEVLVIKANSKLKIKDKEKQIVQANIRRMEAVRNVKGMVRTANSVKREYTRTITDFFIGRTFRGTPTQKKTILNSYVGKLTNANTEGDMQNILHEFSAEAFEISKDNVLKSIYDKTSKYIAKSKHKGGNTKIDIEVLTAIDGFINGNTKAINNGTLDNLVNIENQLNELLKFGRTQYKQAREARVDKLKEVLKEAEGKRYVLGKEYTFKELADEKFTMKNSLIKNLITKFNNFAYSVDVNRGRFYENVFGNGTKIKAILYDNILHALSKYKAKEQEFRTMWLKTLRDNNILNEVKHNTVDLAIYINVRNGDLGTIMNTDKLRINTKTGRAVQLTHSGELGNFRRITEEEILEIYNRIKGDNRYRKIEEQWDNMMSEVHTLDNGVMNRTENRTIEVIRGYFPRTSVSSVGDIEDTVGDLNFIAKKVNDSMTKERVLEDGVDIDLDIFSVLDKVMKNHLFYAYMKEPIDDAARLATTLRKGIKSGKDASEEAKLLDDGLEAISTDGNGKIDYENLDKIEGDTAGVISEEVYKDVAGDIMSWAKGGSTYTTSLDRYFNLGYRLFAQDALGFNIKSALLQQVTLEDAKGHLGSKFFKNSDYSKDNSTIANANSGILTSRTDLFYDGFGGLSRKNAIQHSLRNSEKLTYSPMKLSDGSVSRAVWIAAYRKYMEKNGFLKSFEQLDLKIHGNEEAYKYADLKMTEIMTDNNMVSMNKNFRSPIAKFVFPFMRPPLNRLQMFAQKFPQYDWEQRFGLVAHTLMSMAESIIITQAYGAIKVIKGTKSVENASVVEQYLASLANGEEPEKEAELNDYLKFFGLGLMQELVGGIPGASSLIKGEAKYDNGGVVGGIYDIFTSALDVANSPYNTAEYAGFKTLELILPGSAEELPKFFLKGIEGEISKIKSSVKKTGLDIGDITKEDIDKIIRINATKSNKTEEKLKLLKKYEGMDAKSLLKNMSKEELAIVKANFSKVSEFNSALNKEYVKKKIQGIGKEEAYNLLRDKKFHALASSVYGNKEFVRIAEDKTTTEGDIDNIYKGLGVEELMMEVVIPMEVNNKSPNEKIKRIKELLDKKVIDKKTANEVAKRIIITEAGNKLY